MDKRCYRDSLRLAGALLFFVIYVPHLFFYFLGGWKRQLINSDLEKIREQISMGLPLILVLLFSLHNNRYYRCLFYYRIGPAASLLISWYRPGDHSFIIPASTKIGKGVMLVHPYSTVLNADSIGDNFTCLHCTTLGKKDHGRPVIGDNVTIGCNACVIGNIHIGNNVMVGAGSVVVKDVSDNCVVAGNPAKVIKFKDANE